MTVNLHILAACFAVVAETKFLGVNTDALHTAHDVSHALTPELKSLDDFLATSLFGLDSTAALKQPPGLVAAEKPSERFHTKCHYAAKSLAFANSGSKKSVNHALVIACSRYNYAPRTKACDMFRETLQAHMSTSNMWNLKSMDYKAFCNGYYKTLGAPFAAGVNVTGVSAQGSLIECVTNTKRMMEGIPRPILDVGATLYASCDREEVQNQLGGARLTKELSKASCEKMMLDLANARETNQDYFPFCRSLKLATSTDLQSIIEAYEKNPVVKFAMKMCTDHCPQIAKMVKNFAVVSALRNRMSEGLMNMSRQMGDFMDRDGKCWHERDSIFVNHKQAYRATGIEMKQAMVQMCDFKRTATCNPENMHIACKSALDLIHPSVSLELRSVWQGCEKRKPCNDVCPGINTKGYDFVDSFMTVLEQVGGVAKNAAALVQTSRDMCGEYITLQQCYAKHSQCEEYISSSAIFPGLDRILGGDKCFTPPPWRPPPPPGATGWVKNPSISEQCSYYNNPCFEKLHSNCGAHMKALDGLGQCAAPSYQCPDMFFHMFFKPNGPVCNNCANALAGLRQCMQKHECGWFTDGYLKMKMGLKHFGRAVEREMKCATKGPPMDPGVAAAMSTPPLPPPPLPTPCPSH